MQIPKEPSPSPSPAPAKVLEVIMGQAMGILDEVWALDTKNLTFALANTSACPGAV